MHPAYARSAPRIQQTLDIFSGQWASKFPSPLGATNAGTACLFEDPRVDWAIGKLRQSGFDLTQTDVLELGPLEGGHTYMLAKAGARSVTAIEAHSGAYLKCLVTKELLGIERVSFLFGDALKFLRENGREFGLGFACGFLYHMTDPAEIIAQLARQCRALFLWTVGWDKEFVRLGTKEAGGIGPSHFAEYGGFRHRLHRHDYGRVENYTMFWGGPASHAYWMELDEILAAVKYFGYTAISFERESTIYGSALKIFAHR